MRPNKNILKYPGSKWTIAPWIVEHFPAGYERMTYLEPFFGSGAVFFTKERSKVETINDLDSDVVNLFRMARDYPEELARAVYLTPWAREEYAESYSDSGEIDDVERARRFIVRMWQAIGAKSSTKTGWRKNIKAANGNVARFCTNIPSNILAICQRLKHASPNNIVQIDNIDAFEIIRRHNQHNCVIYADPPYLMETRNGRIYKHEFTNEQHRKLLALLMEHCGPVLLSAYKSPLYEDTLADWHRYETTCHTESATERTETLWCNYEASQQLKFAEL